MKNLKSLTVGLALFLATITVSAQTKKIDVTKSSIEWLGKKVTGKHNGTVNFKEGSVVMKNGKLTGGSFTVDMTSLTATDITGDYRAKLDRHLKDEDFFGTDKFPIATLVFTKIGMKSVNVYSVTADLSIKGITKPVTFDLKVNGSTATATFNVDRTKYDIKYGSKSFFESIGDKAIYDEFELKVDLKF